MNFSQRFKWCVLTGVLCTFSLLASAQQNHFVYLQTENNQPFYIKLNGKVISSSSAGYVILPDVADGDLAITIGFPRNEFPEERFNVKVNQKNEGYLVKNLSDKRWVLFNLQSLAIVEASGVAESIVATKEKVKDDPFSSMLADAVNDSSLLRDNNVVAVPEVKPVTPVIADTVSTISNIVIKESSPVKKTDVVKSVSGEVPKISGDENHQGIITVDSLTNKKSSSGKEETLITTAVSNQAANKRDTLFITDTVYVKNGEDINKISGANVSKGTDLTYTVEKPNGVDTVKVFIPSEKVDVVANTPRDSTVFHPVSSDFAQLTITPTVIPPSGIDTATISSKADFKDSLAMGSTPEIEKKKDSLPINIPGVEITKSVEIPVSDLNLEIKKDTSSETVEKIQIAATKDSTVKADSVVNEVKTDSSRDQIIVLPQVVTSSSVNSDCKLFADDQDFLKVRRKMALSNTREEMIESAKKSFREKCYSTEQIRNLAYLFLSNEGKYLFLDMAYAYASDSDKYSTLETLFTDEYYLNRFRAMIRK